MLLQNSNFYQNRDLFFDNVELLLKPEGDKSKTPKSLTKYGNPITSNLITKFGNGSIYFNGSSCTIQTQPLNLYSKNFTIEFWILFPETANTHQVIVTTYNLPGGAQVGTFTIGRQSSNNAISFYNAYGIGPSTPGLSLNQWYFITATYQHSNTTASLFLNGAFQGSSSISINSQANKFHIGGTSGDNNMGNFWLKAYLEDLRVTPNILRPAKILNKNFPAA